MATDLIRWAGPAPTNSAVLFDSYADPGLPPLPERTARCLGGDPGRVGHRPVDAPADGVRAFPEFTWRHPRKLASERGVDDTNETEDAKVLDDLPIRAQAGPVEKASDRVAARTRVAAAAASCCTTATSDLS